MDNKSNNQYDDKSNKSLIRLYSILAIIIIIIPEWIAELMLLINISQIDKQLPEETKAWKEEIDLRLSSMNMIELRHLAKSHKLMGYSAENRDSLIRRIKKNHKNQLKTSNKQNHSKDKDI